MATLLIARCPDDDFTQPATPLKPWLTTPSGVVVMDKYLSGDFWVISAVQVSARAIIAALGVPPLTSFGLSSAVDELFGKRFGLTFAELLGDFTAELLPACVELGMNRRKLVCHLAGVFMGQ